jgi:hypothetical protein
MQVIVFMAWCPRFSNRFDSRPRLAAEHGRSAQRLVGKSKVIHVRNAIIMDEWNRNRLLQPGHADLAREQKEKAERRRMREEKRKEELDHSLDRGLEDTFPGSDPVALTQPPHSARDKRKH